MTKNLLFRAFISSQNTIKVSNKLFWVLLKIDFSFDILNLKNRDVFLSDNECIYLKIGIGTSLNM